MAASAPPGLRIMIGAASFADAAAALRLVARLPMAFHAMLGGVLVEDPDTQATCEIPGRHIILPSGLTVLAPDAAQLSTLVTADARAFERLLTQTAGHAGSPCIFARQRGALITSAVSAARGWDVLVIGYQSLNRVRGKVLSLHGPKEGGASLQSAAHSLARRFRADQVAFSVGNGASAEPGTVVFASLEDALRALAQVNALAVLVDMNHGPVRNNIDLARLLSAARCPLIVFGAATAQAALMHDTHMPPAPRSGEPA